MSFHKEGGLVMAITGELTEKDVDSKMLEVWQMARRNPSRWAPVLQGIVDNREVVVTKIRTLLQLATCNRLTQGLVNELMNELHDWEILQQWDTLPSNALNRLHSQQEGLFWRDEQCASEEAYDDPCPSIDAQLDRWQRLLPQFIQSSTECVDIGQRVIQNKTACRIESPCFGEHVFLIPKLSRLADMNWSDDEVENVHLFHKALIILLRHLSLVDFAETDMRVEHMLLSPKVVKMHRHAEKQQPNGDYLVLSVNPCCGHKGASPRLARIRMGSSKIPMDLCIGTALMLLWPERWARPNDLKPYMPGVLIRNHDETFNCPGFSSVNGINGTHALTLHKLDERASHYGSGEVYYKSDA